MEKENTKQSAAAKFSDLQLAAISSRDKLKDLLKQNNDNYIYLGLLLKEAKQYYMNIPDTNYKDIYAFAKDELELCKTTVKYLISVNDRFANGMKLKPKYDKYKYSQLREMVSLSDSQLDLVNPLMTVEEIKALKKIKNIDENKVLDPFIKSDNAVYDTVYFKNNKEREDFLKSYKTWELFAQVPELTLKFYRVKLTNEKYIIALEFEFYVAYLKKFETSVMYDIFNPNDPTDRYDPCFNMSTKIVDTIRINKLGYYKLVQND